MTTIIATHEVKDSEKWAKAWNSGPGGRGELMVQAGVTKSQTFRDLQHPNVTGLMLEVADMAQFMAFKQSAEAGEDRPKPETLRMLQVLTP